eukprot:506147-Pelagomonas_calceolata.AAC.1
MVTGEKERRGRDERGARQEGKREGSLNDRRGGNNKRKGGSPGKTWMETREKLSAPSSAGCPRS